MASVACFLHRNTLTAPDRSPSQRYAAPAFKPANVACRAQKQLLSEEEDGAAVSRRLALTVLIGAAAVSSRVSPAEAAYSEAANVFGKPQRNTDFQAYNGDGFKLSIPSQWNPSKEREFPGQVPRYEDNFDDTSSVSVIITATDKKLITDFCSPEQFLSQVDFLRGKRAYFGNTDAASNAVATANILETAAPVISEKPYYFISVLTRTADDNEGGKYQLVNAAVED